MYAMIVPCVAILAPFQDPRAMGRLLLWDKMGVTALSSRKRTLKWREHEKYADRRRGAVLTRQGAEVAEEILRGGAAGLHSHTGGCATSLVILPLWLKITQAADRERRNLHHRHATTTRTTTTYTIIRTATTTAKDTTTATNTATDATTIAGPKTDK
ncbi:hypothetical protein DM02DRAFT_635498 [Periconia macrospinosa]|uniref:Uncharacterized protein n=1 Tax=Periconia macrospinosa TaxID=97972 RepID=A0A2V1D4V8_9PLEO|nr:hypothetical protein DM02DRAFT_635498 [Periconia macrospinosa]